MWQKSVKSSILYFYSLTLLAISTGAKNQTRERINMNDRQIARSDDSEFIAKRLREALSVGSHTAEELTTAANPNGNNLQLIEVPQTMWGSLSQKSGQRQIYNDPSADLPSHHDNNYDYNPSQVAEKTFPTNLPETVFPIFFSTFWQIYKNYTTVIANSQNSITEENVTRTTQSSPLQALTPCYGQKLANFNEMDKMISINTQSYQSELQEKCTRSLNCEKVAEKKQFQYPVYETEFEDSSVMNENSRIHAGEKSFLCSVCAKKFSSMCSLKIHGRIHSGEKPYQCRVCNKNFAQSCNLKVHERVHTGEKPYSCSICAKKFSALDNLRKHEKVHSGERPYQCRMCNKNFSHLYNLKIHERIHTGEKPHQCSICAKKFSTMCSLISHGRIHSGEKPYQCRVCNKNFSRSTTLKIHERVHTGEMPYLCSICAKKFTFLGNLRRHENIHRE